MLNFFVSLLIASVAEHIEQEVRKMERAVVINFFVSLLISIIVGLVGMYIVFEGVPQ